MLLWLVMLHLLFLLNSVYWLYCWHSFIYENFFLKWAHSRKQSLVQIQQFHLGILFIHFTHKYRFSHADNTTLWKNRNGCHYDQGLELFLIFCFFFWLTLIFWTSDMASWKSHFGALFIFIVIWSEMVADNNYIAWSIQSSTPEYSSIIIINAIFTRDEKGMVGTRKKGLNKIGGPTAISDKVLHNLIWGKSGVRLTLVFELKIIVFFFRSLWIINTIPAIIRTLDKSLRVSK